MKKALITFGQFLLFLAVFGLAVYVAQRIRPFHNAPAATAVQTEGPHARGEAARRSESDQFTSNANMAAGTSARTLAEPSPSLAGSWRVATHVESANYAPFSGLNLGYEIQLKQAGDRISGAGQKVSENARSIRSRARTPISVNGTVEGDRVRLRFTEHGARRASGGTFDLVLAPDGKLHGRFASTAANSSGTVDAKRID